MSILGLHPSITVDKKRFQHKFFCAPALNVEDVLPYVPKTGTVRLPGSGMPVSCSERLQCFKKSHQCARCGIKGVFFVRERCTEKESWHINMYAIHNGAIRLMTADHIIPKCIGGPNIQSNLQTMCVKCNGKKSWDIPEGVTLHTVMERTYPIQRIESDIFWGWRTWMWDKEVSAYTIPELRGKIRSILTRMKRNATI